MRSTHFKDFVMIKCVEQYVMLPVKIKFQEIINHAARWWKSEDFGQDFIKSEAYKSNKK